MLIHPSSPLAHEARASLFRLRKWTDVNCVGSVCGSANMVPLQYNTRNKLSLFSHTRYHIYGIWYLFNHRQIRRIGLDSNVNVAAVMARQEWHVNKHELTGKLRLLKKSDYLKLYISYIIYYLQYYIISHMYVFTRFLPSLRPEC